MPITPFLRHQAFDPETVEAMGKAFVTTCEALGLNDRADAMTNLVAEKIIEAAQRGIKNPTALYLAAINEFKSDPHQLRTRNDNRQADGNQIIDWLREEPE